MVSIQASFPMKFVPANMGHDITKKVTITMVHRYANTPYFSPAPVGWGQLIQQLIGLSAGWVQICSVLPLSRAMHTVLSRENKECRIDPTTQAQLMSLYCFLMFFDPISYGVLHVVQAQPQRHGQVDSPAECGGTRSVGFMTSHTVLQQWFW